MIPYSRCSFEIFSALKFYLLYGRLLFFSKIRILKQNIPDIVSFLQPGNLILSMQMIAPLLFMHFEIVLPYLLDLGSYFWLCPFEFCLAIIGSKAVVFDMYHSK